MGKKQEHIMFRSFTLAASATALASFVAFAPVSAQAGGCKHGDDMVRTGAHKGQCAHHGGSAAASAIPPKHSNTVAPKAIVGEPATDATTVAIVTQHPFQGIAQFRCAFVNGARIKYDDPNSGTGWCHD
jgi:hypothetical protein